MRTVTYNAGAYLVGELQRAGVVGNWLHDGGDIIFFETHAGEKISIHLIESPIEFYEIKNTIVDNHANEVHTLFVLWGVRLLPGGGTRTIEDDWLRALLQLYRDRVYAYDIYGSEIFVFPVHFDGTGAQRRVRLGTTVNVRHLGCTQQDIRFPGLTGQWRVAGFDLGGAERRQGIPEDVAPLLPYYQVLGVDIDADFDIIKKAYRLLARRYHPDINKADDAHAKMQAINAAYAKIAAQFDE